MKKVFSIFIIALILASGMNLSMASHLCQGEVVAMKWSFTGKLAGCGMEAPVKSCPVHDGIASNCCQNNITYINVDNNYIPSSLQLKETGRKAVQDLALPVNSISNDIKPAVFPYTNVRPPGGTSANTVNLAGICVFRI